MDPEQESLVQYVRAQRLYVDYVHVATAAFLFYDWLVQFSAEIQFIWRSGRWGYTKILYVIIRYCSLVNVGFLLHNQLASVPSSNCAWAIPFWLVSTDFVLMLSELILVIRTWAVWKQGLKVGITLGLMWIAIATLSLVTDISFLKSLRVLPPIYTGWRGCRVSSGFSVKASGDRTALAMIVLDTVILVLMSISAFRSYRMNTVAHVVHRDGIVMYFYLEVVMIASYVTVMVLSSDYVLMMEPFKSACYSVFTTRIILNIRQASQRDMYGEQMELHAKWNEGNVPPPDTVPLSFRNSANVQNVEGSISYRV